MFHIRSTGTDSHLSRHPWVRYGYRGTSLIRNRAPLGPYSSICLGPYCGPRGGTVSYERRTPVSPPPERPNGPTAGPPTLPRALRKELAVPKRAYPRPALRAVPTNIGLRGEWAQHAGHTLREPSIARLFAHPLQGYLAHNQRPPP